MAGLRTKGGKLMTRGGKLAFIGAAAVTVATSFKLEENAATTSTGKRVVMMHFAQGDVPSGYIPQVTLQGGSELTDLNFNYRRTWPDGSLKQARCAGDFGSFTSNQQKTYDLTAKLGTYDDTANYTWADVLADLDAVVDFTDVWESESDYNWSGNLETFSNSKIRVNIAGHAMTVGSKFYSERIHKDPDHTAGLRLGGDNQNEPIVFEVDAISAGNWFEATHPSDTANKTDSGLGEGKKLYRFSNSRNDHTADIADVINDADHVEIIGGRAMTEIWAWQYAKDTTTTNLDTQQKVEWYIRIWGNGGATSGNIEVYAKLVRPDWDVADKSGWIADVSFKIDGSEREAWTAKPILAHSGWLTMDTTTGNDAARPHWQTAANRPTLTLIPDQEYWNSTGVVPPYDTAVAPDAWTDDDDHYMPMWSYAHRQNNNDTSGYYGRGPICEGDAACYMRVCQEVGTPASRAQDVKYARLLATVAVHAPHNYRTSENTLIPLILNSPTKSPASTVYNADGLGNTQHAYREGDATYKGGYTTPTGGWSDSTTWCWKWASSDDHQQHMSGFMWTYEGETWMYHAMLDEAMAHIHRKAGTAGSGRAKLLYISPTGAGTRATEYSIPTANQYDACNLGENDNIRKHLFHFSMQAPAWGLVADDDKRYNLFQDIMANHEEWLDDMIAVLPTEMTDRGLIWERAFADDTRSEPGYMHGLILLGALRAYTLTDSSSFKAACEILVKFGQFIGNESLYLMAIGSGTCLKPSPFEKAPELGSGYFTEPRWGYAYSNYGNPDTTTDVITQGHPFGGGWADDTLLMLDPNRTVPSELSNGTDYYSVTSLTGTYQLANSSGGAAIDFAGSNQQIAFLTKMPDWDKTVVGADGWDGAAQTVKGDEYFCIFEAGQHWAKQAGLDNADDAFVTKLETFRNGNTVDYATWMLVAA